MDPLEKAQREFEEDREEWERFMDSLSLDVQSPAILQKNQDLQQAPLSDGLPETIGEESLEDEEAREKFRAFFLAHGRLVLSKNQEETASEKTESEMSDEEMAEKAMADLQVNVNRLAAEYYMAHDGDMTGFSNYADDLFAKIDMKEPELQDYFLRHTTFSKIETANDDAEFSTYAMADTDDKTAMRNAMLTFYHANPQYDVSDADIQGLDVGSFRNRIVYAPDGRAFSFEQISPYAERKAPKARMSM